MNGDEIEELGDDVRRKRIGENVRLVREVVREEIMCALKEMKGGKTAGMDSIAVEMLKNGGISIIDCLLRVLNRCMEAGVVSENWKTECIIPAYKWKGSIRYCANYRGISILSIPRKIYRRVLISKAIESTKEQVA